MTATGVTFPAADGRAMRAALAAPAESGKFPGVIVIHEIFGLNADIRRIASRIADLGYVALAPDLYDKPGPRPICIARTLLTLNRGSGAAFDDLDAARRFLQGQANVDSSRIGVIGFCMGGGIALLYAVLRWVPLRFSMATCRRIPGACMEYVRCLADTAEKIACSPHTASG